MTDPPRFNTFCNHLSGYWVGQSAAYTPWGGKSESVWVDEAGNYLDVVYSRALEQPLEVDEEGSVCLVRKVARAGVLADLELLDIPAEGIGNGGNDNIDIEAIGYNTGGSVVFNGGHYSCGPERLINTGSSDTGFHTGTASSSSTGSSSAGSSSSSSSSFSDEATGSAGLSIFEQCLVDWSDRTRLRLRITARVGRTPNGEVDLDVARVLATHEHWMDVAPTAPHVPPASSAPSAALAPAATTPSAVLSDAPPAPPSETLSSSISVASDDSSSSTTSSAGSSFGRERAGSDEVPSAAALPLPVAVAALAASSSGDSPSRISLPEASASSPSPSTSLPQAAPALPSLPSSTPYPSALSHPCTQLPRPEGAQLHGSWSVLTFAATAIQDIDMATGREAKIWVYSVDETRQLWDAQGGAPTDEEGGSLWLPGGVICTFKMLNDALPPTAEPSSNGKHAALPPRAAASPRGLCIGLTVLQRDGTTSTLEREYNGDGVLHEVRHSTAVKGGWSGGRM